MPVLRDRLRCRELVLGSFVFEFGTPALPRIAAAAGADFLVLDTEHSRFTWSDAADFFAAARGVGLPALVRVNTLAYEPIARMLDLGADGAMLPRVAGPESVAEAIRAMKYAPVGERGTCFGVAHDDYRAGDPVAKAAAANARTVLVVQVETVRCLESIEEIVAIDAVDVAWVGHFDLSFAMGLPGQFDHPRFQAAMDRVAAACAHTGKAAVRLVTSVDEALHWIERGHRCLSLGHDVSLYQGTLARGLSAIRAHLVEWQ